MEIETNGVPVDPGFIIESIEKCHPPKEMEGENWYRYIVTQGRRKITGYKTGTLKGVTDHVETFTENLNERSVKGISPNAHTARGRK